MWNVSENLPSPSDLDCNTLDVCRKVVTSLLRRFPVPLSQISSFLSPTVLGCNTHHMWLRVSHFYLRDSLFPIPLLELLHSCVIEFLLKQIRGRSLLPVSVCVCVWGGGFYPKHTKNEYGLPKYPQQLYNFHSIKELISAFCTWQHSRVYLTHNRWVYEEKNPLFFCNFSIQQ